MAGVQRELAAAVGASRAWACYDCGKCTASCPLPRAGSRFSPRRQLLAFGQPGPAQPQVNGALADCLTCGLCSERCPAQVDFVQWMQALRAAAHGQGAEPECPHGGALQSMMRIMAKGGTRQQRLGWLDGSLATQTSQGELFFWSGCTMFYDALFPEHELATLRATRAAVRLLNAVGQQPVVSAEERCCGHDLLWNGDRESFAALARHNVALVEQSGAKLLVTPCAECLRTWRIDYAPYFSGKPPRILHISEYLVEQLPSLRFVPQGDKRVTFQDPCRLGRHLGIYQPPRQLLDALPGVELVEMAKSGKRATCCAGGTWSGCDRFAKKIQVERLREARATGAEILVSACPKCQVHLRCAMQDPHVKREIHMEMRDLVELLADALADPGG